MINKYKFLVIDDNPADLRLIQELLADTNIESFELISAVTLSAASEIIKKDKIDVILLNLVLPDIQGIETFNKVNRLASNIPIIIISDLNNEKIAQSVVQDGSQDYFVKETIDGRALSRTIFYGIARKQYEADIHNYSNLIEYIDDAIYSENIDGTICTWNKAAENIYGYQSNEIVGKHVSILFPESKKNELEDIIRKIKSDGHIYQVVTKRMRKDGKIIDILLSALPINRANELIGISIIARDITTKKATEKQLAVQYRVATILNESIDIGEAARNSLQTICEIFGWHAGEIWLVDKQDQTLKNVSTWFDNFIYIDLEKFNQQKSFYLNEGLPGYLWKSAEIYWTQNTEKDHLCKRKEILTKLNLKSAIGFPIVYRGDVLGVTIFFDDNIPKPDRGLMNMLSIIGEQLGVFINRKHIENDQFLLQEQLRLKNKELEDQVIAMQRANQAKSIFLANMSHELRTPLNSIIGYTELMCKGKVGPVTSTHKEYLGEVSTNAHHLLHLINDILDLTKIESGKMELHPEPTNLSTLMNDVTNTILILVKEKNLQYSVFIDPSFNGDVIIDPYKLKQILYNFLSNAIKFTPSGGKILVRLLPENKGLFRIEVSDTGIGIRKEDIDKLFVIFGQLNLSYSKPYQGIGLGLALTRYIAELLGGRVGVISEFGKGSTFYVVLPLIQSSAPVNKTGSTISS